MHILFYEHAVCERDIRMEKGFLDLDKKNSHVALLLPGKVRDMFLLFQEQKQKRSRMVFRTVMWRSLKTPN